MLQAPATAIARPTPAASVRQAHTARLRALGLVPAALHAHVLHALEGLALEVLLEADPGRFTLLAGRDAADLLVIDADIAEDPATLAVRARSMMPAVHMAIITCYWSDREPILREVADILLYKPPRRGEWQRALARLGVMPAAAA
jgi:hypothetical protein